MKISKSQLKQIIKEELEAVLYNEANGQPPSGDPPKGTYADQLRYGRAKAGYPHGNPFRTTTLSDEQIEAIRQQALADKRAKILSEPPSLYDPTMPYESDVEWTGLNQPPIPPGSVPGFAPPRFLEPHEQRRHNIYSIQDPENFDLKTARGRDAARRAESPTAFQDFYSDPENVKQVYDTYEKYNADTGRYRTFSRPPTDPIEYEKFYRGRPTVSHPENFPTPGTDPNYLYGGRPGSLSRYRAAVAAREASKADEKK